MTVVATFKAYEEAEEWALKNCQGDDYEINPVYDENCAFIGHGICLEDDSDY